MNLITIEDLRHTEQLWYPDSTDAYLIGYPELVRLFEEIDVIEKHHLVVGANAVYGWMPTILRFKANNFEEVSELLERVKKWRGSFRKTA